MLGVVVVGENDELPILVYEILFIKALVRFLFDGVEGSLVAIVLVFEWLFFLDDVEFEGCFLDCH